MRPLTSLRKTTSLSSLKLKDEQRQKKNCHKILQKPPSIKNTSTKNSLVKEKKVEKIQSSLTICQKLQYEIAMLKRVNQSLERQNEGLKKQVAYLLQTSNSRKTSICEINSKKMTEDNVKSKILGRLTKKRDGIYDTDCESTGIFSSKLTTSKHYQDTIADLYDDYAKKMNVPTLQNLYEISKNYFNQYKQNYIKLQILFKNSNHKRRTNLSAKLEDLLFLFEVPILYKENPTMLKKSLSKQKIKNKTEQNSLQNSMHGFIPELISPTETLEILQKILKTVIKSPKLFRKFEQSKVFRSLLKKMSE